MIACAECVEQLLPDDPRVKSGRYNMCGCDYCNKPKYFRDLEKTQTETKPVFRPRPIDDEIDQLKSKLIYFQNKFNEHVDKSKTGELYE